MHAVADLFRRLTSLGLWGGTCAVFSLWVASGNVAFGAAILAGLLLFLAILSGPQLIVALWLMGSPTVFSLANQLLAALPFITMERVMFVVLSGMIAMKAIFGISGRYPRIGLEMLIVVFLCYTLISLAASTSSIGLRRDLWFYLQYAMPMFMFILSRRIEWTERGVKFLLAGLTVTGAILAVVGILQELFGITIFTIDFQNVTAGHVARAHGTFSNAHTYSATLVVFLSLTIMQFGIYRDALVRFVLLLTMFIMVVGILLGQTRAPWGGAALALFIILLRDRSVRPLLVTGGVLALIACGVVTYLMIDQLGSFVERVTDLRTMAGRMATWATALNMIAHNPMFGVGFGVDSFALHKPEYLTGVGSLTQQYAVYLGVPHNEYLHVAVLLGLPGLILFLCIVVGMIRLMFRIHMDTENSSVRRRLAVYVGATIIGLLFNSTFSDTYLQDYFWMLTYFLAGLATGMPRDFWRLEGPETLGRETS